jgi:hypothetical protein
MKLRPYQLAASHATLNAWEQSNSALVVMPTGCHDPEQPILMWEGDIKAAKDIAPGDLLMGMDGSPRKVLVLHQGRKQMVKILPVKGDPFVVTEDHVLTLVRTREKSVSPLPCHKRDGEVVDVSVLDWMSWPDWKKHIHKLFRMDIDFTSSRRPKEVVLLTGFSIQRVGIGDYAGFTVDGDHRYLLGDFTVTHNCGKTVMFADITRRVFPRKALVLAHRSELIHQAKDKIQRVTGFRVEVEMADLRADLNAGLFESPQVIVSSIQTQTAGGDGAGRMGKFDPMMFGLLIIDECFPAGTMIDGRPIEQFAVGDPVQAFDHVSGAPITSRVIQTFKSVPSALVLIRFRDGRRIVCTPGHPFFRPDLGRYAPAIELSPDSLVLTHTERIRLEPGIARVASVEILEPGSDGRFGGLCPDGFVYNLEVEHHHNYFAEGVLVHNCHHATAKSYRRVIDYYRQNPNLKVLGVTATPDRADEEALGQVFDQVAFEYDILNAIHDGWLVPIEQQMVEIEGLDFSAPPPGT